MHADWFHLIFNMVFLWTFGNALCSRVGPIAFLLIYLTCGVVSGGLQLLITGAVLVGASGAISGVIAFSLVLFPSARVKAIYFLGLFGGLFSVNVIWLACFWYARDVFSALRDFFVGGSVVAYWAHVGGFLCGGILAAIALACGLFRSETGEPPTLLGHAEKRHPVAGEGDDECEEMPSLAHVSFSCPSWIRWVVGVPLLFSFSFDLETSPLIMIVGAVQIAPDIAGFFGNLAGGILYTRHESPPTPVYGIAEALVARGDYVEAEVEYEKIIHEFPNEVKSHKDLIEVAIKYIKEPTLADQFYERGMQSLKDESARDQLTEFYDRTGSLFKPSRKEAATPATEQTPATKSQRSSKLRLLRDT